MKKALSLALALVLCLALAAPAFAVNQIYNPGAVSPNALPGETRVTVPSDEQGWFVVPDPTDANLALVPSLDPVVPDYYYEVMPLDTLAAIAFAFYGDSTLAGALYKANELGHFLATGGILEANRALRIPAVLNGVARLDNRGANSEAFYPVTIASMRISDNIAYAVNGPHFWIGDYQAQNAPNRMNQIIYIVREGDTLAKIAQTWYGNDSTYIQAAIQAANTGRTCAAGTYMILPLVYIGY